MVINRDHRLLFGALAAAILAAGIVGLAFLVPGYDPVRQTVSEIGEMSSPARIPFALMLCGVAACLIVFTCGVRAVSMKAGHGTASAFTLAWRDDMKARRLVAFSWVLFALIWVSIG